jgi:hypothetical protein
MFSNSQGAGSTSASVGGSHQNAIKPMPLGWGLLVGMIVMPDPNRFKRFL